MRRAEMARRRKNLSEKRNEEEKVITPQEILQLHAHISSHCVFSWLTPILDGNNQ